MRVLECLEAFGKRLNAFRTLWELMVAFWQVRQVRQVGKHNPIWCDMYGLYGMYGEYHNNTNQCF